MTHPPVFFSRFSSRQAFFFVAGVVGVVKGQDEEKNDIDDAQADGKDLAPAELSAQHKALDHVEDGCHYEGDVVDHGHDQVVFGHIAGNDRSSKKRDGDPEKPAAPADAVEGEAGIERNQGLPSGYPAFGKEPPSCDAGGAPEDKKERTYHCKIDDKYRRKIHNRILIIENNYSLI